jgi:NADPH:quinone reductase-like Zn-dependent oxidoreductase
MTLPATMSAVIPTRHGGTEALVWRDELPMPRPGPGEAPVRVLAAGANATDIYTLEGWHGSGEAWDLLSRAQVADGERVLVTGASGGVGLAVVHLAILCGADVTGQCALGRAAAVRAAGARVLDRAKTPEARGFDVVIDVVGGAAWQDRLEALRPGGRYATSGAVGGPLVPGALRTIYLNDLTLYGGARQPREVFAGLVTLITTAHVRPVVSNTYHPREIARAEADLVERRYPGKLVLIPEASDQ